MFLSISVSILVNASPPNLPREICQQHFMRLFGRITEDKMAGSLDVRLGHSVPQCHIGGVAHGQKFFEIPPE